MFMNSNFIQSNKTDLILYEPKNLSLVIISKTVENSKDEISKVEISKDEISKVEISKDLNFEGIRIAESNSKNLITFENNSKTLITFEGKILTLIYSPVSKLVERDSLSNEELYKAEFLGNMIRINSIALYKEWFREVKDIDDVVCIRKDIESTLTLMRSVNRDGFINSNDILKDSHYLLIAKAVRKYRGKELEIPTFLKVNDRDRTKLFKWCHDRISLEALLALTILKKKVVDINGLNKSFEIKDDYMIKAIMDEITSLKLSISELEGSIDSSLVLSLKRKGLTFYHIRYTGFDNEFVNKDNLNNELVSVQISTNTKTLLKIPITRQYTYSKVTTLGGKFYEIYGYNNVLDNERLLRDFNIFIDSYRLIDYRLNDALLESIAQKLIDKGIPNIKIDDQIVFDFGRTKIKQWIKRFPKNSKFKFEDLVKISNKMTGETLENDYNKICILLKSLSYDKLEPLCRENNNLDKLTSIDYYSEVDEITEDKVSEFWEDEIKISEGLYISVINHEESLQRYNSLNNIRNTEEISKSSLKSKITLDYLKFNINRIYQNNFIGHFNSADLSMYEDYEVYKTQLDIIKHSFITISKPIELNNTRVRVYDSQLLSPASKKSLKDLGSLYDIKMAKVELPDPKMIEKMHILAYEDWDLFKKYALQDTVIPLVHASFMEDFNFKLGSLGIPITLSKLSVSMVQHYWKVQGYKGYQFLPDVKIGDASVVQTPKVLSKMGPVGEHMSLFVESMKGGRNESFMYGIDRNIEWFDYDLKGAYTTAMCLLGNPDYRRAKLLTFHAFQKMDKLSLLYSYTVIKAEFKFPKNVKFPNLPVFVDKDTTAYPLEGETIMTSAEYFTAQRMGCRIEPVKVIFHIPFENLSDVRKEKEVLLKDFQKYKVGEVNFRIHEGRLVSWNAGKSDGSDESDFLVVKDLKNLKDLKILNNLNTLNDLKGFIYNNYTFEDFRQQPNKTLEVVRFIINSNLKTDFKKDFTKVLNSKISKALELEWLTLRNLLEEECSELGYSLDKFNLKVGKNLELLDKFEILDLEIKKIRSYCDDNLKEVDSDDFFCFQEGNILYNIHLLKIQKLAEVSINLIDLNSTFTRKDLNFINLNSCFDIDKFNLISNNDLNLTNFKERENDLNVLFRDIVEKLKLFDDINSEINRCLMYKTPYNLSTSNKIGWSPDLTPCSNFGSSKKKFINAPYRNLIIYLQSERAKHPKKSILNELYKEMANSVYGQTVRGIAVKNKFDSRSGEVKRMNVGELTNGIIASWITSFVRSIIGEMMFYCDKMGGKIVSVTTDGFITDIKDLESKILDCIKKEREEIVNKYKNVDRINKEISTSNFLKFIIKVRNEEALRLADLLGSKEKELKSGLKKASLKNLKDEIRKLRVDLDKLNGVIETEEKSLKSFLSELEDIKSKKKSKFKNKQVEEPALKGEDASLFELDRIKQAFSLLEEYRLTRDSIHGNPDAMEVKSNGTGLASWCVRGQLGLNSKISALTGYQKKGIDDKDLFHLITDSLTSFNKSLDYIQTTLRSATDIYKKGGHVTRVDRDQVFRTVYDNRRIIDKPIGTPTKIHIIADGFKVEFVDVYSTLLDSRPVLNREQCESFRSIAKVVKDSVNYNVMNRKASNSLYKDAFDIALKQFIRALYSRELNLEANPFKFHKDLCVWLNGFRCKNIDHYIQINPNMVGLIKSRGSFINNSVPVNEESKAFVIFIKEKFPEFDDSKFFLSYKILKP